MTLEGTLFETCRYNLVQLKTLEQIGLNVFEKYSNVFEIWSSCVLDEVLFPANRKEGKTHCYVLTLTNTITQERNAQNIQH